MLTSSQGLAYLDSIDREIYGLSNSDNNIILEQQAIKYILEWVVSTASYWLYKTSSYCSISSNMGQLLTISCRNISVSVNGLSRSAKVWKNKKYKFTGGAAKKFCHTVFIKKCFLQNFCSSIFRCMFYATTVLGVLLITWATQKNWKLNRKP